MALEVRIKPVYDEADSGDGHRMLIDHVWPRGIYRERAKLDVGTQLRRATSCAGGDPPRKDAPS